MGVAITQSPDAIAQGPVYRSPMMVAIIVLTMLCITLTVLLLWKI